MSAIRITFLYCDGGEECPREESGSVPFKIDPHPGDSAADQRAEAKGYGWTREGKKDYCPSCAQRIAEYRNRLDRKAPR